MLPPMAKRRPRLVPKIVFQVALGATAIPAIAMGCKHEDRQIDNPVAAQGYGVGAPAYVNPPPADSCGAGTARVPVGESGDGGFACVAMGVAAVAYDRPKPSLDSGTTVSTSVDASADAKAVAPSLDAGKRAAAKPDSGARDISTIGTAPTPPPPLGVAYRGYVNGPPQKP